MRPLFIAGPQRSGTTGLARYLNLHPEILLCIERYRSLPPEMITPRLFTFERILDYKKGETQVPREHHLQLIQSKERENLKWIGDKKPAYYREFRTILKNNPRAHFIVTYRPVEEVAESFEARANHPEGNWREWANFEVGVERWNQSLRYLREFMESGLRPDVLVLDYHAFFDDPDSCIPMLSEFLGLEFSEPLREAWRQNSRDHARRRRDKDPLTEEQRQFIRDNADREAEQWVLGVIEEQRNGPVKLPRSTTVDRQLHEKHIEYLEKRLIKERRTSRQLRQRSRWLNRQIRELRDKEERRDGKSLRLRKRLARLKKLFRTRVY